MQQSALDNDCALKKNLFERRYPALPKHHIEKPRKRRISFVKNSVRLQGRTYTDSEREGLTFEGQVG